MIQKPVILKIFFVLLEVKQYNIAIIFAMYFAMTNTCKLCKIGLGGDNMTNNYKIYKDTRNASWQFLIDHQIGNLPIDLKSITASMDIKVFVDKTRKIVSLKGYGATIFHNDMTIIAVSPDLSRQTTRYTIAHEIGHIVLGHTLSDMPTLTSAEREYQAERFAIGILAPACVLWGLDLHTPEEIAKVCDISMTSARIRAERMEILYERRKFLTDPRERQVFQQFKPFIDSMK